MFSGFQLENNYIISRLNQEKYRIKRKQNFKFPIFIAKLTILYKILPDILDVTFTGRNEHHWISNTQGDVDKAERNTEL